MKYILLRRSFGDFMQELPIIFPSTLVHADVAKALCQMDGMDNAVPVAAGELSSMDLLRVQCHGESTTLAIESRGIVDNALISTFDYMHGFLDQPEAS